MNIKDLMNSEVHFVSDKSSVLDAAKLMSRSKSSAVIVGNNQKIQGIFSEKDILEKVIILGLAPAQTPVKDIMTHNVVTVDETKTHEYALALMIARDIRHLPVIDETGLCSGIINLRNLVKPIVKKIEKKDDSLYINDDYERYNL